MEQITGVTTIASRPADAPPPTSRPHRAGPDGRERRPLWLLIPGAVLLFLVVGVPFALAVWMDFPDLDQYSLRDWLGAPFIGIDGFAESVPTHRCRTRC